MNLGLHSSLLLASKQHFDSFRFVVAHSTARTVKTHIHPQQRTQFSLLIASKLQIDSFRFAVAHSTVRTVISIHIHDNGHYSAHYLKVNYLIANCILSFASDASAIQLYPCVKISSPLFLFFSLNRGSSLRFFT